MTATTLRELAEAMRDAPDAASKKLGEAALLHRLAAGDGDVLILAALEAERDAAEQRGYAHCLEEQDKLVRDAYERGREAGNTARSTT